MVCKNVTALLLQLHADLPTQFAGHERRLYVFSCRRKTCRRKDGSIRVLRGTRIDPVQANSGKSTLRSPAKPKQRPSPPQATLGSQIFESSQPSLPSSNANPFAITPAPPIMVLNNLFPSEISASPLMASGATFGVQELPLEAEMSTPSVEAEPWPADSALAKPYTFYHLDAAYEALAVESIDGMSDYGHTMEVGDGSDGGSNQNDELDAFESTIDKDFQRFADLLSQNPGQVLRYEYGGRPLLYAKKDHVGAKLGPHQWPNTASSSSGKGIIPTSTRPAQSGVPPCGNCGSSRTFEMQLTPHAITELEVEEESIDGMEWGTIIVGVCTNDCVPRATAPGQTAYIEEWAGVQWEEIGKR